MDEIKTGTTTLGFVYKDGLVLAADRRVSAGNLVFSHFQKIDRISSSIGITMAGSVADVQTLIKIMQSEVALYEVRSGAKMSTKAAVGLFATILFNNRFSLIPSGFIIGGYDVKPEIYSLDTAGTRMPDKYTSIGSGSVITLGVLETEYKDNMSEEEAVKLAHKAISTSIRRDVYTGDGVDIVLVDKKGYRKLTDQEISKIIVQK
ncbi:MAG: proteasome subunit beta [Candidatus Parvarchaeota archaeon]|nr:proteasome subunit beta [Candidatus Parvarchaeota archaeon]